MKYKVKNLIELLGDFNPEADVEGVFGDVGYDLKSVGYGGGDGCKESNCDYVVLHYGPDNTEEN